MNRRGPSLAWVLAGLLFAAAIGAGCECGDPPDEADAKADDDFWFDDDSGGGDDDHSDDDTWPDDDSAPDDDQTDDDQTDDDLDDDDTFVDPCEDVEQVYDPVPSWEENGVTFRELIPPCVGCDGLSIAVNDQDQPVIAATRGSYLMLYTRTSECGWRREAVTRHAVWPALKSGPGGTLHLLYYDPDNQILKYGDDETGAFEFETVPWPEGSDLTFDARYDMAVDADGVAHVALIPILAFTPVWTVSNRTGTWVSRVVDPGPVFLVSFIDVVVGADGREHVAVDVEGFLWGLDYTFVWSETGAGFSSPVGLNGIFPVLATDSNSGLHALTLEDVSYDILYWPNIGTTAPDPVTFSTDGWSSNIVIALDEADTVHAGVETPDDEFLYFQYVDGHLTKVKSETLPGSGFGVSLAVGGQTAHFAAGGEDGLLYLTPTEDGRHLRKQRLDTGIRDLDGLGASKSPLDGVFHFCIVERDESRKIFYGTIANDDLLTMTTLENFRSSEFGSIGECAVALDRENEPHLFIAVENEDPATDIGLYHLWREADEWLHESVDEDIHWLERPAAVFYDEVFHVYYRKEGRLWEAVKGANDWANTDLSYEMYFYVDATVNNADREIFVAFDSGNQNPDQGEYAIINVIKYGESGWELTLSGEYGLIPSITADEQENVHLVYADSTLTYPSRVLYRKYTGSAWSEPEDVGSGMSNMAIAAGNDRVLVTHGGYFDFSISTSSDNAWSDIATIVSSNLWTFERSAVFFGSNFTFQSMIFLDGSLLEISAPLE